MKDALVKTQNEVEAWKEMLIVLQNIHFIITECWAKYKHYKQKETSSL